MNTPISVTVITRDASATLERCLASVAWADEILVIDSGSRDNTLDIAQRLATRVDYHPWAGYGAQKNYAAILASYDWILSLDADEWLSPELAVSIQELLRQAPSNAGYQFNCRNRFMGRWLYHGEGYPDPHLRLFDRRQGNWQPRPIHEQVAVAGPVGHLYGDLLHESAPCLEAYLAKQNRYTQLQAELLWQQERRARLIDLWLRPLWRFIRLYGLKRGFLDGVPGLVHIIIGCFNTFIKYAKLRERALLCQTQPLISTHVTESLNMSERIEKTAAEWQQQLTPEQFSVCRCHGTEPPFIHPLHACNTPGHYQCICCGAALFDSTAKYDSGSGWPSFFRPLHPHAIGTTADNRHEMRRTEVHCARCAAHLGHVFPDGPPPTGLRYCINALALNFVAADSV